VPDQRVWPTTQKRNSGLAAITALAQNNEYSKWVEEKDIDFKPAA
jgi:hypothetical protein